MKNPGDARDVSFFTTAWTVTFFFGLTFASFACAAFLDHGVTSSDSCLGFRVAISLSFIPS
jgi:hypothetical protein